MGGEDRTAVGKKFNQGSETGIKKNLTVFAAF